MLDLKKKYRTRDGKRIIHLTRGPDNSSTGKKTFPISGLIEISEKPRRYAHCIWTEEGKYGVIPAHDNHGCDLIEVPDQ